MSPGKPLSVKIGLGVGDCRVLFVGGQFKRCEYLIVGEAMRQACESETKATDGGQTIMSTSVYNLVKHYYDVVEAHGDDSHGPADPHEKPYYRIVGSKGDRIAIKSDAYLMRTHFSSEKLREKLPILRTFVPAAIAIYLDIEKENWSKEIRMLTVMFLNLKVDLSQTRNEEGMNRIQEIVHLVQRCVYRTKGSLNKFLMDDKGSVMLICWGLPPLSSPDDPVRSVLTALDLVKELKKYNCGAYMGIATGTCFTGVCGTIGGRREYSLLGEMVNLSARHMQKAIYHAKDLEKSKGEKVDYVILLCEKTRELIQNKIPCDYVCQGELKGFSNIFYFYQPKEIPKKYDYGLIFLPEIRTHKNNFLISIQHESEKRISADSFAKAALTMFGRNDSLNKCVDILKTVSKGEKKFISIRGVTGSGKSLFIRKAMHKFIEEQKDLKFVMSQPNHFPFIFVTFQTPHTIYNPLNGFSKSLKEMYQLIQPNLLSRKPTKFQLGTDFVQIECDAIGELIINNDCISCVKYLEEILETNLSSHYSLPTENPFFKQFFAVKEISPRDTFFESRKIENKSSIVNFFASLIKFYQDACISKFPIIFVVEDAHSIDELSIELIKNLVITTTNSVNAGYDRNKGIAIITSYQDEICPIIKNPNDKFSTSVLFDWDDTFLMENLSDIDLARDLLRYHIPGKVSANISHELINIILTKSFVGNPLFMIEIFNSLIESGYVVTNQEFAPSPKLIEMYILNDWSGFTVPLRMEKILGNIIDNLSPKEIILMKYASVIGNLFDIDKLNELNPFNSITMDDLLSILKNLESLNMIEILYDLKPKQMVCKFSIPFLREVLFQRMLIEHRNEIHLNVARKMQYNKFSYMPHKMEEAFLENHLATTEKTILKHMEEKDDEKKSYNTDKKKDLNINNLKIIVVKDICEKLKLIDLRIESREISLAKRSLPLIYAGLLEKKSDKYISWENRYIVITNTKFFYWYQEQDYRTNKKPLGSFDLKHLYLVEILRDKKIGDRDNLLHIGVSSWFKKDKPYGSREYFFSCKERHILYHWVITLNFLRVKAMYDEFSSNFGLINLPLPHEIMRTSKLKIKEKFTQRNRLNNQSSSNNVTRKSHFSKSLDNSVARRLSFTMNQEFDEVNLQERISKTKDIFSQSVNTSLIIFLGFMQHIVFSPLSENNHQDDQQVIPVPPHLSFLKTQGLKLSQNKNEGISAVENKISRDVSPLTPDFTDSDKGSDKETILKEKSKLNSNQMNEHLNIPKFNDINLSFHEANDKFVLAKNDTNNKHIESLNVNLNKLKHFSIDNNDDDLEEVINNISAAQNSRDDKEDNKDGKEMTMNTKILSEIKSKNNSSLKPAFAASVFNRNNK
jgi:class 3 adenylate cyclase